MSADAILDDALLQAGYARLTARHLAVLEDYLQQMDHRSPLHWPCLHERLGYDLGRDLDALHAYALRHLDADGRAIGDAPPRRVAWLP